VNPPYVHTSDDIVENNVDNIIFELNEEDEIPQLDLSDSPNFDDNAASVSKYRKKLCVEPKSWKKGIQKGSISALTEIQAKRVESLNSKIQLEERRLEAENKWRDTQYEFEREKFQAHSNQREIELRLKERELEKDERLRIMEFEKEERVAKFKIEQEMKLQLELAKLKHSI